MKKEVVREPRWREERMWCIVFLLWVSTIFLNINFAALAKSDIFLHVCFIISVSTQHRRLQVHCLPQNDINISVRDKIVYFFQFNLVYLMQISISRKFDKTALNISAITWNNGAWSNQTWQSGYNMPFPLYYLKHSVCYVYHLI